MKKKTLLMVFSGMLLAMGVILGSNVTQSAAINDPGPLMMMDTACVELDSVNG